MALSSGESLAKYSDDDSESEVDSPLVLGKPPVKTSYIVPPWNKPLQHQKDELLASGDTLRTPRSFATLTTPSNSTAKCPKSIYESSNRVCREVLRTVRRPLVEIQQVSSSELTPQADETPHANIGSANHRNSRRLSIISETSHTGMDVIKYCNESKVKNQNAVKMLKQPCLSCGMYSTDKLTKQREKHMLIQKTSLVTHLFADQDTQTDASPKTKSTACQTTGKISISVTEDIQSSVLSSVRTGGQSAVYSNTQSVVHNSAQSSVQSVTQARMQSVTINGVLLYVLSVIGRGGSSKVEQVVNFADGSRYALKTVHLEGQPPEAIESFKKEIHMLQQLQFSDKVITMYDYEYKKDRNELLILLECGDTDLAAFLKKKLSLGSLNSKLRCYYWHAMLLAVQVLHSQGIIHSDIKPANFMLVAGEVKLIDFGIAKQLETDMTSLELETCVGTLNYMSPEILAGAGQLSKNSKTGRKSDVWSLGCILYYMTYGHTPYQKITNMAQKVAAISTGSYQISYPDIGEAYLIATLQACLERNVKKRASIEELLSHDYVK